MKKIVDWRNIYLLPRKTTGNINLCVFQNNILNNVLYLNKKLLTFRKVKSALYSFRSFGKLSIGVGISIGIGIAKIFLCRNNNKMIMK